MTSNDLRFLVEGIFVTGQQTDIGARTDAALRLLAGAQDKKRPSRVNHSVVTPRIVSDWLPEFRHSSGRHHVPPWSGRRRLPHH